MIDIFRASQLGVIGTPQDAIEHIEHLQELSGGYGTHLIRVLDWANPRDTFDSYELFAREVDAALPGLQPPSRGELEHLFALRGAVPGRRCPPPTPAPGSVTRPRSGPRTAPDAAPDTRSPVNSSRESTHA